MTAGAVRVTMGEFFRGGVSDFDDFHIEVEGLAREGMVGVDHHLVGADVDDREEARSHVGVGLELHAGFELGSTLEGGAGDGLDEVLVTGAVALFGGDGDVELISRVLSFKGLFESRDDVAGAVEVGEGSATGRGVKNLATVAGEGVVDGNDLVFGDVHWAPL